jgi:hypothetical protein
MVAGAFVAAPHDAATSYVTILVAFPKSLCILPLNARNDNGNIGRN